MQKHAILQSEYFCNWSECPLLLSWLFTSLPLFSIREAWKFHTYFPQPLIKSQKSLQFSEVLSRQTQATEFSWKIDPNPLYSPWFKLSSKLKIVFITPESKLCEAKRQHLAWKDFSEEKVKLSVQMSGPGSRDFDNLTGFSQRWLELNSYFWVQFIVPPVKYFSQ